MNINKWMDTFQKQFMLDIIAKSVFARHNNSAVPCFGMHVRGEKNNQNIERWLRKLFC